MCTQRHPEHLDWAPCVSNRPDADHPDCQFFGPNGEQVWWHNPNYVQRDMRTPAERSGFLKETGAIVAGEKRQERQEQQAARGMEGLGLKKTAAVRRDPRPTEVIAARAARFVSDRQKYIVLLLAAARPVYGLTADDLIFELGFPENNAWGRRGEVSELEPGKSKQGWEGAYLFEPGRRRPRRSTGKACEVSVLTEWGREQLINIKILLDTDGIVLSEYGREQCREYGVPLADPEAPPRPMAL